MKSITLIFTFILVTTSLFGQKIKFDDDKAFVDGEAYLKWVSKVMDSEVSISSLTSDKEEIFVMYLDYNDPKEVTQSNPKGTVRWMEFNFLALNIKCEVDSRFPKGLLKVIIDNNLYVDGTLNEENVKRFVQKYGTRFSDNRPGGDVNIIINK